MRISIWKNVTAYGYGKSIKSDVTDGFHSETLTIIRKSLGTNLFLRHSVSLISASWDGVHQWMETHFSFSLSNPNIIIGKSRFLWRTKIVQCTESQQKLLNIFLTIFMCGAPRPSYSCINGEICIRIYYFSVEASLINSQTTQTISPCKCRVCLTSCFCHFLTPQIHPDLELFIIMHVARYAITVDATKKKMRAEWKWTLSIIVSHSFVRSSEVWGSGRFNCYSCSDKRQNFGEHKKCIRMKGKMFYWKKLELTKKNFQSEFFIRKKLVELFFSIPEIEK